MRLYEILSESVKNKMEADVKGLLLSLKASHGDQIPTNVLIKQMNALGYSMTKDSVVPFLTQLPMVQSADTSVVNIGNEDEITQGEENMDDSDQLTMDNLANKGVEGTQQ